MIPDTPARAGRRILEVLSGQWAVDRLLSLPRAVRRVLVSLAHLSLAIFSCYVAFLLRFENNIPDRVFRLFLETLPWLAMVRAGTFFAFRLEEGLWRYASLWDLRRIVGAVVVSTVLFIPVLRFGHGTDDYPRSIFIIDAILLLFLLGAFRLSPRAYRELSRSPGERRVLIVGAGDTGERMLRELQRSSNSSHEPIGFVDDDRSKVGVRIHGAPILGTLKELPEIVAHERPDQVLIALPNARPSRLRELVSLLEPFNVAITTVRTPPGHGLTQSAQVRSLSIEDLLSRPPIGLGTSRLRELVGGRRVLVSGAGGSIGSELSLQIAALAPESLVLYERYENGLYSVASRLHDCGLGERTHEVIGDVTDAGRLDAVMREHRPHLIFHAAAHKHVPLMEGNPCEAVKNNVGGTHAIAKAAIRHGVERFILISTDKAVNPTSVMGATKRIAEILVQQLSLRSATRFTSVRFGNVLGSNGSVLLRFQEQVKAGGPVTVTHPEITRYFMLIPEAVELVLHAAAIGRGGDTLILDMGEQIKVVDLARSVIRLSGHIPDEEIPIVFTGLRPGEKLYEELAWETEQVEPSQVDKIFRIVPDSQSAPELPFETYVEELERRATAGNVEATHALLARALPGFPAGVVLQSA
ncbi:MAG: polysaccharide biosynthesis protein [Vicinamibacterales bacterium]